MKSLLIGTFATFFLSTLSGCVIVAGDHDWDDSSWQSQQRENRATISELELQAARSKIISKMGAPSFSDAFVKEGAIGGLVVFRSFPANRIINTVKAHICYSLFYWYFTHVF